MDPTPTPWYKRDFDVHIALDKGLGSVLLLAATAVSLMLANSAFSHGFIHFWEHFHFGPASLGLHLNAHEWVNEGLMALFFFNVGLEIKREFVYGSLSNFRAALLPCVGALGGMIFPMGVYLALNSVAGGVPAGWAIPMATDIAFAMGVYNFFKNRMPPAVATFLLTLATVDDLGAIAVIAVCFAKGIVPMYLGVSAALCGVMALACKKGVTNMVVHTAMGVALWVWHDLLDRKRDWKLDDVYLGPGCTEDQILSTLKSYGAVYRRLEDPELMSEVVEMIDAAKVVGWYQGRLEWGPRALGHRSILGDPRNPEMRDIINIKIKKREGFRPFAPSVA